MLLAGFLSGDTEAISLGCHDQLHQPFRSRLMPGVADILALPARDGLIGAVISGAGPTMLLMHELRRPDACLRALAAFRRYDSGAQLVAVTVGEGYGCTYGDIEGLEPPAELSSTVHGCRSSQGLPAC